MILDISLYVYRRTLLVSETPLQIERQVFLYSDLQLIKVDSGTQNFGVC